MKRFLAILLIALVVVLPISAARVQINNVPATISNLIVKLTSIFTPSSVQAINAAGDAILANATVVIVNPDADYTLTSTPTIADGTAGQVVYITTANAEGFTVTIQDQDTLANTNLQLLSSARTITGKKTISLVFDGTDWIEFGGNEFSTLDIILPATENISIDGSTYPRNMTLGAMRFEHKPAIDDTRAIHIEVDANSKADTHGIFVSMTANGVVAGEAIQGIGVTLNSGTSTGGTMDALRVSNGGVGGAVSRAIHADPGVVVILQESGSFGAVEQAWDENGGFTDVTAAFNATGTDVTIFSADNDKIYIGAAADFNALRVNLDTNASNPGIKPVFEFSIAGPLWTVFTPNDATNGFRTSSTITWDESALTNWVSVTINAVAKKYIRITRTQANLNTAPIEDTIQVSTSSVFTWDEFGDLDVREVVSKNEVFILAADFVPKGDNSDNNTVEFDDYDTTARRMFERTTGLAATQDMTWYTVKDFTQTPTSLTFWTRASHANVVMTMTATDIAGNVDSTGSVVVTPSGLDTWEEQTYTFTSTYTNDEEVEIKMAITVLDDGETADFGRCKINY